MERRVLLAIALSFLVLVVYQWLVPPVPPNSSATFPGTSINQSAPATPASELGAPTNASPENPNTVLPAAAAVRVGEVAERDLTIETARVRAVFTNRGGRIKHWFLKEYKNGSGQLLDLVPDGGATTPLLPFSLRVNDAATTARLNDSLYAVTQAETLAFEFEAEDGLHVRKTFTVAPDGYDIHFGVTVQKGSETLNPNIEWGPGLGDEIARMPPGSFFSPNYTYPPQAIFALDGDVERIAPASFAAGMAREGVFRWAGIDDHYFISAVIEPSAPLHLEYRAATIDSTSQPPEVGRYVSYSVRFQSPPERAHFFFGPKQLDVLRAVDPEFTKAIYFGMFAPLAVPLLGALKWLHGFIGNWGLAIIVLTILINLVLFPLRHKAVVSMRKMQDIQPQMKAIQERYAKFKITDPERQKMNQEVMELYKAKGVNPASGCIPTLLTMPFLFAFYSMLSQAIELRGAEFGLWIHDLAVRDPYYVTPLLMGATMIWQQRMAPPTADPTQQKMMMMMPFFFTFIFLGQPSGLAIYWFVSNLWAIGQQYFTNYLIGPPKVHNVRPVGEKKKQ